jgi:hypothetical protein
MMLSERQRQRNLDNIRYVRSLLKQKLDQRDEEQTRTVHTTVQETQETNPEP